VLTHSVRHSLTHAATYDRARSCPAAYSSPTGGRLDPSALRWREQRAGSVCLELPEGIDLPSRYPGVIRYSHPDTFSGSTPNI